MKKYRRLNLHLLLRWRLLTCLKQKSNRLARSKEVDDIILSNFFKGAFDRGSATQGHWVGTAMRNRKIFVKLSQQ